MQATLRVRIPNYYRRPRNHPPGADHHRQRRDYLIAGFHKSADLRVDAGPDEHQGQPEQMADASGPGTIRRATDGIDDAVPLLLLPENLRQHPRGGIHIQPAHHILPRRRRPELLCRTGHLSGADDDSADTGAGILRWSHGPVHHRSTGADQRRRDSLRS